MPQADASDGSVDRIQCSEGFLGLTLSIVNFFFYALNRSYTEVLRYHFSILAWGSVFWSFHTKDAKILNFKNDFIGKNIFLSFDSELKNYQFLIYRLDLEKREGCGVMAHERLPAFLGLTDTINASELCK